MAKLSGDLQIVDDALNDALGPIDLANRELQTLSDLYHLLGDGNAEVDQLFADVQALQSECAKLRNRAGDMRAERLGN